MIDVYKLALEEFKERKTAHWDRFPPFFLAAIGTHMFNQYNRDSHVYVEAGGVCDTRLHLLFTAPPGFSKTFWLSQFLRGEHSILAHSGVDIGMEAAMTEAGFVGTIRLIDGEVITKYGAAKIYDRAILGIEEFSAITEMMKQQFARQLDTALLGALDSGWVYKRLAAGDINYQTGVSLFTGVQPARFDLSSGLGRRFFFINFIPTKEDFEMLKLARRGSKGIRYNPVRTNQIRDGIRTINAMIKQVKEISFSEKVFKLFDELNFIHYEEPLFEKILIGYKIMRGKFDKELYVDLDNESERLVRMGVQFRKEVRRGAEFSEVIIVLREHGGSMTSGALKERLVLYGLDWSQSSTLIGEMYKLKAIEGRGQIITLSPSLLHPKTRSL